MRYTLDDENVIAFPGFGEPMFNKDHIVAIFKDRADLISVYDLKLEDIDRLQKMEDSANRWHKTTAAMGWHYPRGTNPENTLFAGVHEKPTMGRLHVHFGSGEVTQNGKDLANKWLPLCVVKRVLEGGAAQ